MRTFNTPSHKARLTTLYSAALHIKNPVRQYADIPDGIIFIFWQNLIGLGQHRTKIVRQKRSQIFRQIVLKFCRHTAVCQEISVQDDGKERPKEVPLGYKFMTCKVVRRALCGVALAIVNNKIAESSNILQLQEQEG